MRKEWLVVFFILSLGCSVRQQWQTKLWYAQDSTIEKPEIGKLGTESLDFGILVTEFRKVNIIDRKRQVLLKPSVIAISISCRNQINRAFALESNSIQVVDASQMLVKPLPLDHVMYTLYGGQMRESAQQARLAELSQPIPSDSSVLGSTLAAVVEVFRASEREAIIAKMYREEASLYNLYYHSFTPVSLPSRVATAWTEYYPYTSDTITGMLQGQKVEDGITFGVPPPPRPKKVKQVKPLIRPVPRKIGQIIIAGVGLIVAISIVK